MTMRRALFSMVGIAFLTALANGQVLQTGPPNNGSGGVWFDLTDLTPPGKSIEVYEIDIGGFDGTPWTFVTVQVWTKSGSHVGYIEDPSAWELHESDRLMRDGQFTPVWFILSDVIEVPDGETIGVYLQALDWGGIRFTGFSSNPPQEVWENDDLRLFGDHANTASTAFGGDLYSPGTFSGAIHYEVVDSGEPSCIADWNGDGEVDINDFFAYLSDFEAGDPRADLNNDGEIDINDFFIFLTEFEAGC